MYFYKNYVKNYINIVNGMATRALLATPCAFPVAFSYIASLAFLCSFL